MKMLLQPARVGFVVLLLFAAVAAAPGIASADETIQGTATGKTIPLGNGTFRIVGTFTDPSRPGVIGTYVGTYVEMSTGYTTCRFTSITGTANCYPMCNGENGPYCNEGFDVVSCNRIQGSVTIRSQGESQTLSIGSEWFSVYGAWSAVCLNPSNREIHDVFIFLTRTNAIGAVATGSMVGTSTPGPGGLYEDVFQLRVTSHTTPI